MPNPFSPLQGYDLPTAAQRILEEIDGKPPTPAHFVDERATPGTLTVTPDNRGPAAVVVGLSLTQVGAFVQMQFRADVEVKGVTLVEGEAPVEVLDPGRATDNGVLLSPIRLDSKTPMNIQISNLTGKVPLAATVHRVEIQCLYGSVEACDEVMRRLGQARWWSFYAPPTAATSFSSTLTVEIGGRPTYARQQRTQAGGGSVSASISLDGTSLTPQPVQNVLAGVSFLPHAISQAQVYAYTLAITAVDNAYWAWHGPSDDY
jgi:hypothetical protein